MMRPSNPNFMNGVPELIILRLLRQGEMYGYELVQAIRDRSQAALSFGEGVVYPVLHSLEKQGHLDARRKTVAGRNRVYYALTPQGRLHLDGLATDWRRLTATIHLFLDGGRHADAV